VQPRSPVAQQRGSGRPGDVAPASPPSLLVVKTLLIAIALLVGLVGVGLAVTGPRILRVLEDLRPKDEPHQVRTHVLAPDDLVEFVTAPGEVEPETKVDVASQVSARIEVLPVREGDTVRKGDVVVRLDDRDLQAALESAEARRDAERFRLQSEQARLSGLLSNVSFARKELERMQSLHGTGDVSRKSLDEAEERMQGLESNVEATRHAISVIESSLEAAESDITRARDGLDNTVITAPMNGVVTALNMEVGEQVLGTFNNLGSTILTIADLDTMILEAEVAESDIAAVREGQAARIHINAYPDEVFRGAVTRIALQRTNAADGTGVFEVEVQIELEGRRIYSGLAANVDIEIEEHDGLVVESQAIVERLVDDLPESTRTHPLVDQAKRATTVVYRLVDGKAVCTPVRSGPSDLRRTLVEAGVEAGDEVIVGPYKVLEKIADGDAARRETDADEADADEADAEAAAGAERDG
jgi:HlyD family secretion protein